MAYPRLFALSALLLAVGSGCDAHHAYLVRGQVIQADWEERLHAVRQRETWAIKEGASDRLEDNVTLTAAAIPSATVQIEMNPFRVAEPKVYRVVADEHGHFEILALVFGGPGNPVPEIRLSVTRQGYAPFAQAYDSGDFYVNASGGLDLKLLARGPYILVPLAPAPQRGAEGGADDRNETTSGE